MSATWEQQEREKGKAYANNILSLIRGPSQQQGSNSTTPGTGAFFPPPSSSNPLATQRNIPSTGGGIGGLLGSALDAASSGVGAGLGYIGQALDVGNKYATRPAGGALAKLSAELPEFFQGPTYRSFSDERKQNIENADSYTDAWNAMFEGHPVLETAAEVVADPLNLIGLGAVGKGAKVARMSPRVAALLDKPSAQVALRGAEAVDDLAGRAAALPITAPVKGVGAVAKRLPGSKQLLERVAKPSDAKQLVESVRLAERNLDEFSAAGGDIGNLQSIEGSRADTLRRGVEDAFIEDPSIALTLDDSNLANLLESVQNPDPLRMYQHEALRAAAGKVDLPKIARQRNIMGPAGNILNKPKRLQELDRFAASKDLSPSEQSYIRDLGLNDPNLPLSDPQFQTIPGTNPFTNAAIRRTQLPISASTDEVITEIGAMTNAPAQAQKEVLDIVQPAVTNNRRQFEVVNLFNNPDARENLAAAMMTVDPVERKLLVGEAFHSVNQKWSGWGVVHPFLAKLDNWTPNFALNRDPTGSTSRALAKTEKAAPVSDQVATFLEDMISSSTRMTKTEEGYQKGRNLIGNIIQNAYNKGAPIRRFDIDKYTIGDLNEAMPHLDPKAQKEVRKFLNAFGLKVDKKAGYTKQASAILKSEGLQKANLQYLQRESLLERWTAQEAKRLGVSWDKPPKFQHKIAKSIIRGWREQALLSIRYHGQNAADMTFKSAILGVNPLQGRSVWKMADDIYGMPIPDEVSVSRQNRLDSIVNPEFASGESVYRGLGTAGRPAAALVEMNRRLARGMEDTYRGAAYMNGFTEYVRDTIHPQFRDLLSRELDQINIPSAQRDALTTTLDTYGHEMSADLMRRSILTHTGDAEFAQSMADVWNRGLSEASTEGIRIANLVHFDVTDERQIEADLRLKDWVPFHFWATRNIPFYFQTFAQHPELMRGWESYNRATEEEREREGLTGRFRGTIEVNLPGVDGLLDAILGPGTFYFNPLVVMSIADQFKPRYTDDDQPAVGRILDEAGRFGVSPAPWVNIPLTALGIYGDQEAPNVLRHSGIIAAGTEQLFGTRIDLETPVRAGVNKAREIRGEPPYTLTESSFVDYYVKKRLAEMSVEQTGEPNDPQYVVAMSDPTHPLFQEALKQVRREQAFNDSVLGFMNPFPTKRLTDTEREVREDRKETEGLHYTQRRYLEETDDNLASTYSRSFGDARRAQINSGFAVDDYDSPVLERLPWFQLYLDWLKTQPEGADRSPDRFLALTKGL